MEDYEKRASLAEEQIVLLEEKINKLVSMINNEMNNKVLQKNEVNKLTLSFFILIKTLYNFIFLANLNSQQRI